MSYQMKKNITNIVSTIVLTVVYFVIIYNRYQNGVYDDLNIFVFYSRVVLIFIPISIVAKIVISIVFHIGNTITNEVKGVEQDNEDIVDERDKLIMLKSNLISMYIFSIGFILALVSQLVTTNNHLFFLTIFFFGFAADVISEGAQFKYYKRGV